MLARKSDPVSLDDSLALIRCRIRERRLYEARFLYRQLGDGIDARERKALEGEVAGLLQRAGDLHRQARVAAASGQREEAFRLYEELEAIALDVPGLAEEKRALVGAAALMAKVAVARPEPEPSVMPPDPGIVIEEKSDEPGPLPSTSRPRRRLRWLWLAAGLVGLALLLMVFWRDGSNDSPPVPPPTPPPAHNILIQPRMADAPVVPQKPAEEATPPVAEQAAPEPPPESSPAAPVVEPVAEPIEPAPEPAAPPSAPLDLGTLRLKSSGKKK